MASGIPAEQDADMNGRRLAPERVEWLLIATAVGVFLTGAILLVISPAWWGWYLQLLDPWYWSCRAWIIAVAVLVEILIVMRFCAKNRKPPAREESGRIELLKRIVASVVLLGAVVSIVESMIPWSQLHPFHWYWVRVCWYWNRYWWLKASVPAVLVVFLLALLGTRAWLRRLHERREAALDGSRSESDNMIGVQETVP
jgi:hypothetical protein